MSGDSGRRSRWRLRVSAGLLVVAAAVMTGVVGEPGAAYATPQKASIVRTASEGTDLTALYVYSPAMRKTIKVQVLTPAHADRTRPSLYLLSGLGEEDPQNSMWLRKTDARRFYADKNVNVVMPLAGNGSLYTDWERDDPKLGRYQWETFLIDELPPLIDATFNGNGKRAIAGISMGAGAGLVLAARHPGFYRAVASYSGCYTTTGLAGQTYPRGIVTAFGGNPDNMWGPPNDPQWAAHDVVSLAGNLRGTTVYVSSGTGMPGKYDEPGYPGNSDPANRQVVGGGIEFGTYLCTRELQSRLVASGIPATIRYVDPGTHSWPYWRDQQTQSWPTIARGLNS
ncbi:alpha/beta hydrolase [Gordonia polyisoprenivorans]|uniref:alpha/beta hydrolase n=1 Tax=Gordonia polyisoprenivorans TaxID=84595 RepID=UPI000B99D939|nr:alpha/beta hydrolase family protein [Gordonia polyisoprenivorans]OZC32230.1 mycolyltransferase [Gordonia polyisoprenivorans]